MKKETSMGFLDFLFGSKTPTTVEEVTDRIWLTQQAKFNGVREELEERFASNSAAILLVGHFPDTLKILNGIAEEYEGDTSVTATLAEDLTLDIAGNLKLDETVTFDLIVAERHPLLKVDTRLMEFAEELPCLCRVAHFLALDDPLMKRFSGDWVENMLKRLGMKEDEAIESQMILKRVKGAQKQIESEAFGNSKAESAAKWMEENLPNP
jgi:hypothetical protein